MADRFPCDLSHFSFRVGGIGGLQTISCVPIIAGDGLGLNMEAVFRLSPLRRYLAVDTRVDLFAFFVPHRHVYGDDWIDFIKEGTKESITFTGTAAPGNVSYLGCQFTATEQVPKWVTAGYNRIWNQYFRAPTDSAGVLSDTAFVTSNLETGKSCGPIPVPWSTGTRAEVGTAERDVAVTAGVWDIVDAAQVKAAYRTEVERQFFAQRYRDVLDVVFGSYATVDQDQRPTLIGHEVQWLSGYDIDGTGDASLGQFAGKSAGVVRFGFPRRFFNEHGALWLMALLRFPTIHAFERPFLMKTVNPTYLQWAGDPSLLEVQAPEQARTVDYFQSTATNNLGYVPYGQWLRYHPSQVHRLFQAVDGWSFYDDIPTTMDAAQYITQSQFDEVFQTTSLGHWQASARVKLDGMRIVPPARRSLFAGAN